MRLSELLFSSGNLLPQVYIGIMYLLAILLWASCASHARVRAQEHCQVTTKLIGQITQLSYSLTISNTSFKDEGSQAQQTGGLELASQMPSTTASPSQGTLDCATDVPGFDSLCGQRPGSGSVIIQILTKRRLFSYEDCADACAMHNVCTGAAFQLVKRDCILYSYIPYLVPSKRFETFIKKSSSPASPSVNTTLGVSPTSFGGQVEPTTGKAISAGLASHPISSTTLSSPAQGSNGMTLSSLSSYELPTGVPTPTTVQSSTAQTLIGVTLTYTSGHSNPSSDETTTGVIPPTISSSTAQTLTGATLSNASGHSSPSSNGTPTGVIPPTVQSSAAQTSNGASLSNISGHSTSASLSSPQSPPSSGPGGSSTDFLTIIPTSTVFEPLPTSTSLSTQQISSGASRLVTASSKLLPVSTSSIGSSSYDSSPSTTSIASPTVPTCYYRGYDDGLGNIGFYADAVSGTLAGCDALCDANPSCLSFALETDTPACILYNHTIIGYDLYSADSPYNFFLRGGGCPPIPATTSPSSTSASPLPSPIFPVVSLTFIISIL